MTARSATGPDPPVPSDLSVAETHISVVVFSGDTAYKWYKPVTTAFLDHATPAQRREGVRREVELNRRLAPDVYLGTAELVADDGQVLDHLTRMRRLPAHRRLSALVDTDEAETHVDAVARTMAVFHTTAVRSDEVAAEATSSAVDLRWRQNLEEMKPFAGRWVDPVELREVGDLADGYLRCRAPLFEARIAQGWACDGHGDLLADDIFCLPDGPRILDCLDFDDRLRWGDVLADLSFLMMDLERLGCPGLAARLLCSYGNWSGERHPRSLADHYVALRALIRAKVAFLRAEQGVDAAIAEGRDRMSQARAHLRAAEVRLVLVGGPPGSGKSTVADRIGAARRWVVLGSDELRRLLRGADPGDGDGRPPFEGDYRPERVDGLYTELLAEAERLLVMGESVVLDASWLQRHRRAAAAETAERAGARLVEIECDAPEALCEHRIVERRAGGGSASEVTVEAARLLRRARDPWPSATRIDTSGSADPALARALEVVGP